MKERPILFFNPMVRALLDGLTDENMDLLAKAVKIARSVASHSGMA